MALLRRFRVLSDIGQELNSDFIRTRVEDMKQVCRFLSYPGPVVNRQGTVLLPALPERTSRRRGAGAVAGGSSGAAAGVVGTATPASAKAKGVPVPCTPGSNRSATPWWDGTCGPPSAPLVLGAPGTRSSCGGRPRPKARPYRLLCQRHAWPRIQHLEWRANAKCLPPSPSGCRRRASPTWWLGSAWCSRARDRGRSSHELPRSVAEPWDGRIPALSRMVQLKGARVQPQGGWGQCVAKGLAPT
jgi:hypothetical protein